jgi:hypothetical protein
MSDDDLKKILFTLYILRANVEQANHKEYAKEMIDLIEKHLFGGSIES